MRQAGAEHCFVCGTCKSRKPSKDVGYIAPMKSFSLPYPIRSRFTTFVCMLSACALSVAHAGEPLKLNLRQALEMAKSANYQILIGEESVEASKQAVTRARSGLLPTVDAGVTQGRSRQYSPRLGVASTDNRVDALLRARLALLDFKQIANFDLAKYDLNIARFELETLVQDVYAEIAAAYLDHLRNEARLKVILSNIERDTVLMDMLFQSEMRLKQILNLNLDTQLELEPMKHPGEYVLEVFSADKLQDIYANRSDYQSNLLALEKARVAKDAATWERLPSIELSGDWGYGGSSFHSELENEWGAQIGISIPLFEGFRIRANELTAQSAIRRQQKVVEQLEQNINSTFRVTLDTIRARYELISISKKR